MTTAKARREEIYHLAVTTGLASVEELSRHFAVTASTIRRDLAQLNEQLRKLVERIQTEVNTPSSGPTSQNVPVDDQSAATGETTRLNEDDQKKK